MEHLPTFNESLLARYWPADPFNGEEIFASKLPLSVQVQCALAQAELNQRGNSEKCWEPNEYDTLCKVTPKFAEKLKAQNSK